MTMQATEQRLHQGFELREIETTDSLSMLRGRAVPYGEDADIGWFMEQFAPGSLAKSIAESARALPLLMFHNSQSMPIGVAAEWDDTDRALVGTWRLDNSVEAQRAAKLAKQTDEQGEGMLNFMSIRFAPIRSTWTYVEDWNPDLGPSHKDRVVRQEARLVETSLVTTPAYKGATVEWVRTGERPIQRDQQARELTEWRAELERLRAGAGA